MWFHRSKFYIPIILLWGSVMLSSLNPVLVQSDVRFDPYIERNDMLRIDPGGDIALDDLVIYRLNLIDYVAQIIGLPGDEVILGLDGSSIIRNGERIVLAPARNQIQTSESGIPALEDGQAAVYVHNVRRNPVIVVISQDAIRGPVDKIYRYSAFGRAEWLKIYFYSAIVLALVVLPYATYTLQRSRAFIRLVVLVSHSFLTMVVAAALTAASWPGDPFRIGINEPVWWWFPLTVVEGFRAELLLAIGLVLAAQWLMLNRPWRREASG
jgi:hypothetical protein